MIGQPLFDRHGRGVVLNSAGEALLPVARDVVRMLDGALSDFRSGGLSGKLRVGIPDEFGMSVLPRILADFSRQHPKVELTVQCAFSSRFEEDLSTGKLDLAVFDCAHRSPNHIFLRETQAVWVTARQGDVEREKPVPVAVFDRACWWRDHALSRLSAGGRPFRVAFASESMMGILAAVEAGIAVGVIGADRIRPALRRLNETEGFPSLSVSHTVLARRNDVDPVMSEAMAAAIHRAMAL